MGVPVLLNTTKVVRSNCVRATFEERPRASDPEGAGDATNPANWTLSLLDGGPILSIARIDARADDAFVQRKATRGVTGLTTARTDHGVVLLPDGRVLAAGGTNGSSTYLSSVARFDPSTGLWTACAAMPAPRARFAMVMLADGRVLVAGGATTGGGSSLPSWIYDPLLDAWRVTAGPGNSVFGDRPTALRLADERVLLHDYDALYAFSPPTEMWEAVGEFTKSDRSRRASRLALMRDDRVVIFGGIDDTPSESFLTDIFDPREAFNDAVVTGPDMNAARANHVVVPLNDGRVFVFGGKYLNHDEVLIGEILDAAATTFVVTADGPTHGGNAQAALLPEGRVVVVGGISGGLTPAVNKLVTIFDPTTQAYTPLASAPNAHASAGSASVRLPNGLVVFVGGLSSISTANSSVDIWTFVGSTGAWSSSTLADSHLDQYIFTTFDPTRREVDLWLSASMEPGRRYELHAHARVERR